MRPVVRFDSEVKAMTIEFPQGATLHNGNCIDVLPTLPPAQLILTSPPYDDMRRYDGGVDAFDFKRVAAACANNLAVGGVIVWVVRDAYKNNSATGTSLRQCLYFMDELGLNLHQPMIYEHWSLAGMRPTAYYTNWEYVWVFSKGGAPAVANLIKDKYNGKQRSRVVTRPGRNADDTIGNERRYIHYEDYGRRGSIWSYPATYNTTNHPAPFPYKLAADHIQTWTNPGDLVIDPMSGSGTVIKAATDNGRKAIGIEVNKAYCVDIEKRMMQQPMMFGEVGDG